jgi:DNA-binding SARP family transcriptional activator
VGVAVLGPAVVDGSEAPLGRRDRVVLCALALPAGQTVSAEELMDALWRDGTPWSGPEVVQGCIVRLGKLVAEAIATVPGGYTAGGPRSG